MKFRRLTAQEISQRIPTIITNLKIPGLVTVFSEYFAKFTQNNLGGWFQGTKSWWEFWEEETLEFVYFFRKEKANPTYFEFFMNNFEVTNYLMAQIAKETLHYMYSLSTNNIRLPKRILIVFTMISAKAGIRAGAYLEICAPYWLFPIVEAYTLNDDTFREKFYLLVSSLIHEIEHAANTEETIEDAFNDNEHVTTFAEYLALPMGVRSRHESEYLPTIKNCLVSHRREKISITLQPFI